MMIPTSRFPASPLSLYAIWLSLLLRLLRLQRLHARAGVFQPLLCFCYVLLCSLYRRNPDRSVPGGQAHYGIAVFACFHLVILAVYSCKSSCRVFAARPVPASERKPGLCGRPQLAVPRVISLVHNDLDHRFPGRDLLRLVNPSQQGLRAVPEAEYLVPPRQLGRQYLHPEITPISHRRSVLSACRPAEP